jgi:hypothetical protein
MTRDASGKTELLEQALHPFPILRNVWINLAVSALQVRVSHERRTAVARTDDINYVEFLVPDDAIEVDVDEIEAGSGAPMADQARLDMLALQRFRQQRVVEKIDLTYRQIV